MPLYEYECKKCGRTFEVLQRTSDPALTVHDHCGGALEKLLSPPAFQFKGSGWYVTDYAKGSSRKEVKKEEKPAAAEAKKEPPKAAATEKK
ncbi:MAG: zinc ribbon domain-containing protein [Bryobacterales bacterium]|nr:zinc ribbon domain-containing protein [Bryobacterales bacterium]